jgi:DNA modification methylase
MRHEILCGDVLDGLRSLPDACVQCVVTSPPYLGLRDYGVEGQIGLEPTLEAHIEKLVEVFREVWRVLRDDGTLWLNLGDSYNGSGGAGGDYAPGGLKAGQPKYPGRRISALKPKDLVGIPWRVAFALQADGWYLRSDVIWSKPNPMPESVTDRPTKSHEYVFLLTKSSRYFYDADAVREAHISVDQSPRKSGVGNGLNRTDRGVGREFFGNPAGRNRRTVWEIATQPTPEAHFATFPEALVEPCIKAGTSERGCCPVCGAPWRRVTEREEDAGLARSAGGKADEQPETDRAKRLGQRRNAARVAGGDHTNPFGGRMTTHWAPTCTCNAGDPIPCVVLDPFGGSGTVAKVARDLGRSSVMIELNPAYVGIMKKRLRVGEQLDTGVCEYAVREVGT